MNTIDIHVSVRVNKTPRKTIVKMYRNMPWC